MSIVYIRLYTCIVHVRVPNSVNKYQLRDWVQSLGPSFVHAACQLGFRYGHCYTRRHVVCLDDVGRHHGLTTPGVWTGPECVSEAALGEPMVDWRTPPLVQRMRQWTVATSPSSVYRTVMDRIALRISFGIALQIFGTALFRHKEILGFIIWGLWMNTTLA